MPESNYIQTICENWQRARGTNQTSSSFVAKVDTLVEPVTSDTATGSSIIRLTNGGMVGQNLVRILPYGVGSDTNTFSLRVYAWSQLPVLDIAGHVQWVPDLLAEFLCTLTSGQTGVAGGLVAATEYYCDTITQTYPAVAVSSIEVCSNAANEKAHIVMDMKGAQRIELTFTTGSSATSCNSLIRQY